MGKLKPRFLSANSHEISIDYHVHSSYNDDAQGTVEECVNSALTKGLTSIAITNHVWRTSAWIDDFLNEVAKVRSRRKYHLLAGFEAKVININGEVDIAPRHIKKAELILGALHNLPTRDDYIWLNREHLSPSKVAETVRNATLNMISRVEVNVIAHPLALYYPKYHHPFPNDFLEEIVQSASKSGIALEVYNSKYPLPDLVFKMLISLCVEYKALISVGSNAHHPSEIGDLNYTKILKAIKHLFSQ